MKFLFLLPVILFLSCNITGNYHLPAKTMENMLIDINIAESYSTIVYDSVHKKGMKNADSLALYYREIFKHYNITPEQFTENLEWYKAHPDELDTMFNRILPKMVAWQNQLAKKDK